MVYPGAEHGLFEYEVDAAGERQSLRQPATYLPLMHDFIRAGRIGRQYGNSVIYRQQPFNRPVPRRRRADPKPLRPCRSCSSR